MAPPTKKVINMTPIDEDEADRVREIDTIDNFMFSKKATYERGITEPSISAVDERHSQEEDDQSFKSYVEEQHEEPELVSEGGGDIDEAVVNEE